MSETRYGWVLMSVGVDSTKSISELRKAGAFNLDGEVYADNDQGASQLLYVDAETRNMLDALETMFEEPMKWEVE